MIVYVVIKSEAHEDGTWESVDSVWLSKEKADERKRGIDQGCWTDGEVYEMEVSE